MSSANDVIKILQAYTRRKRTAEVAFSQLVAFTSRYIGQAEDPNLDDLDDNTENLLAARLLELEKQGRVVVRSEGSRIQTVVFPEFYPSAVTAYYRKMHDRPGLPFPEESTLEVKIPPETIRAVDVRIDFVSLLTGSNAVIPSILRLMFPDGLKSIIATTELLPSTLAEVSVHKIRGYLRSEKNESYIRSKLGGVFRNREMVLKEMLGKILTTPDNAIQSVLDPSDFSFHFWTTLCSVLIKDIGPKKDKLQDDHDVAQSAYMLGYYNVHYKALAQKKRDTEMAVQMLDVRLGKEPYGFTITDIYNFTDTKGVLLTKRYTTNDINNYLTEKLRPETKDRLAALIRTKGPDNKDYYFRKEHVLKVLIERLFDISRQFADHYVNSWTTAMKEDRRPAEMTDDIVFAKDVHTRMAETYPMICSLCRFDLIYLAASEQKPLGEVAAEINRLIDRDNKAIRPMHQVLQLDRAKLADDARLLLPFWQAIPWLNAFVRTMQRMLLGIRTQGHIERRRSRKRRPAAFKSTTEAHEPPETGAVRAGADTSSVATTTLSPAPASGASNRKLQAQEFRKRIEELQQAYVGKDGNVEAKLEEIIERWNPLLDPVSKSNLVEDVNSLVRDFLRKMKVGFRLIPPDRARIQNFAEKLSESEVFDQIRRKDALKTYLELYMLKMLGNVK